MSQAVINVEHVSKRFRLQFRGLRTLKSAAVDALRGVWRRPDRQLWALQDVSFSVRSGECLGLIGGNGAGKSTLLALLASTMQPTNGRIQVLGKVSSLLELGAGFHPDLTGRENIYLCGSILGLTRRQISERFEAIVDFAGLADFIDEPVKHYSSGMYIRLGFAVAVESDPDVLLIDEVLAVGDAPFQRKCLLRMADFRKQGKTMLIISHDLATIRSISDRILFLDKGRICGDGPPSMVVEQYENFWRQQNTKELSREWGTHEVELTSIEFLNDLGAATTTRRGRRLVRPRALPGPQPDRKTGLRFLHFGHQWAADSRKKHPDFRFEPACHRGRRGALPAAARSCAGQRHAYVFVFGPLLGP